MRAISTSLFALAVGAVALAGCSPAKSAAWEPAKKVDPAKFEASVDALKTAAFTFKENGKAESADQIDGVVAALPAWIKLTHDAPSFDAAAGATAVTNVRISPADLPEVGVQIQQIRLWGFDEALATARLNGQRLDETAQLARRIEITGANAFGLASLMNPVTQAYMGAVENAVETAVEGLPDADAALDEAFRETAITRLDMGVGKIILDDVVLRPWVLKPATLAPDSDWAEVMPFLQGYAAGLRSIAMDTMAAYDMKIELIFEDEGLEQSMLFAFDTTAVKGMRGGDTDFGFAKSGRFDMGMQMPRSDFDGPAVDIEITDDAVEPETPPTGVENATDDTPPLMDEPPVQMRMTGNYERLSQSGVRMDKVLGYLARGEMPPRTETDLMSLGQFVYGPQSFTINGAEVISSRESTLEFTNFHWFIPTQARMSATDAVYNVRGFLDFIGTVEPEALTAMRESEPNLDQVMEMLGRYALDKPSLDFDLGWTWDAKTGDARINLMGGLDQYMRLTATYEGGFPSFDAVSALVPADAAQTDEVALNNLFSMNSTLKSLKVELSDEGGLEKGFAMAIDIGKLAPAGDPATGFLKSQTPQGLRTMASSAIYMAGTEAGKQAEGLKVAVDAFAGFLAKGGKVTYTLAPKTPVAWSGMGASASDPKALLSQLGFSATHTPPPEAKAPAKTN